MVDRRNHRRCVLVDGITLIMNLNLAEGKVVQLADCSGNHRVVFVSIGICSHFCSCFLEIKIDIFLIVEVLLQSNFLGTLWVVHTQQRDAHAVI